ncbi:MAG: hypothetical protein ABIN95_10910 [Mucilaginibacter sp.]
MENLPAYISILFLFVTAITLYLFHRAAGNTKITGIVACWLVIQGIIGYSGFYTHTDSTPPRLLLLLGPPLVAIALLFITPAGRRIIDAMDIKWATGLHTVRIAVEVVILLLFINGKLPKVITFEGRNFDILSGLTAPFVVMLLNSKNKKLPHGSFTMELYLPGAAA